MLRLAILSLCKIVDYTPIIFKLYSNYILSKILKIITAGLDFSMLNLNPVSMAVCVPIWDQMPAWFI